MLSWPPCVLIAVFRRVPWRIAILVLTASYAVLPARLPLRLFTSADGLGSSFVSYMMRDSRGFLWFCTRDGLTRFDGHYFVNYSVGEKNAPPGVEQILETRDGIYWIATTGGMYRFDPNLQANDASRDNQHAFLHARYAGPWRGVLAEDSEGNVWLGANELYHVVFADDNVSLEKVELSLPPNAASLGIAEIYIARDKTVWLVTAVGLIHRFANGGEVIYQTASGNKDGLTSVVEDVDGRIWLARLSGIYVLVPNASENLSSLANPAMYDLDMIAKVQKVVSDSPKLPQQPGEILEYTEHFTNNAVKFLYRSSDDHIWIANGDGVVEFDGNKFIAHTPEEGFTTGSGPMIEDSGGNLWFGFSSGISRLDRHGFTTFDRSDGLKHPAATAIGESPAGTLFVANNGYEIAQYDGQKFTSARPRIPADTQPMWTSNPVLQDSAGEWWLLSSSRLYRFASAESVLDLDGRPPTSFYDDHTGLRGNQAFHIFEDSKKKIWISNRVQNSALQGLTLFDRGNGTFTSFGEVDGYPLNKAVSSFAEDTYGNIWLGFYDTGLGRYKNGRFEMITSDQVPSGAILALHADRSHRLWIGSAVGGLGRIDDTNAEQPAVIRLSNEDGLASNNVRSLTEDDFGNIYVGTARGVDRISPDASHIRHYSVEDGLAGDFVSVSYKARDGSLWFGTPTGLSRLIPEREAMSKSPPVWISSVRIAGEPRFVSDLGAQDIPDLELSSGQSNLQLEFFGIDYNISQPLRYEYKLVGADQDWSQPSEQRTVNYANLSPGSYSFLVRAVGSDGQVSDRPATVTFKLLPPIWQRWWFVGVAVLVLGFSVYALDRFRVLKTRQVKVALAESKENETRFRTLAETASDAIITINVNSNIVYANEAAGKIFGYERSELVGRNLTSLMPDDVGYQHEAGFGRYIETKTRNIPWSGVELPGKHRDGSEIPLELSFGEFELQGQRYFTGVARDISERKKAEEELRRSREERFHELERIRMRIATDLHDDIGASLSQIALLSEIVGRQAEITETNGLSSHLRKISSVSTELVQAMGDIVWAINPRKDSIEELMKRMRRFAADTFFACGIKFRFETPEISAVIALGANIRREVFVIFKEAVNNVARHSKCRSVDIELVIDKERLRLRMSDDGCGFDVIEKLSESFSPEIGGNGLLNIRKRAVDLGGSCEINSEAGKGTRLDLDIPLKRRSESMLDVTFH